MTRGTKIHLKLNIRTDILNLSIKNWLIWIRTAFTSFVVLPRCSDFSIDWFANLTLSPYHDTLLRLHVNSKRLLPSSLYDSKWSHLTKPSVYANWHFEPNLRDVSTQLSSALLKWFGVTKKKWAHVFNGIPFAIIERNQEIRCVLVHVSRDGRMSHN